MYVDSYSHLPPPFRRPHAQPRYSGAFGGFASQFPAARVPVAATPAPAAQPANTGSQGAWSQNQNPYATDPGYQLALQNQQATLPMLREALQHQIAQRLTDWGDPNLGSQAKFGVDKTLLAAIKQNYASGNSQLARLDHSHDMEKRSIINQLAGRGILFSGETGYQQGNSDRTYGNNVYDGQHAALSDIANYRQQELQQESQLRDALTSALETAFQNATANPSSYSYGGAAPSPAPNISSQQDPRALLLANSANWGR